MNWIMPALCSSSWASPTQPSPHIVVVPPSWLWSSLLSPMNGLVLDFISLSTITQKKKTFSPSVTTQLLIELSQSLHAGKQR